MPVSEISKGVFIVAPRELPKYKDTAAGEYTSVFTKQRANQWEMAQKQALMNMELGSKRYAEEMKTYRDRLDALDARQKELESLKVRVADGRLKAEDAAAIAALREGTSRQKTAADFAAKKAEVITMTPGSTTTTSGSGGGRAGKGPTLGDVSTDDEAELDAALAESAGDPATAVVAVKARRDSKTLGSATPEETDAQNFKVINDLADMRAGTTGEDIEDATDAILLELSQTDGQFAASHARVTAKQAQIEAGGGGAPTTRTTVRPADVTTKKRPKLGDLPDAPEVARPEIADAQPTIQDINELINNLEMAKLGIARPTLGGSDFITDSRDIMRGRFGGFSGAADALPYEQRNVAERLIKDPAYGLSAIEGYRDYLAQQRAEAATAARLRESMAEGPANTSVEALRAAPGAPPVASADIPVTPVSVAPVEPPSPAQSVPEAVAEAPVALRPEAAALMTPAEIAEFKARLQASADAAQMRRELAAIDTGGSEINPAFRTPLLPPPLPPRQALSTMAAPQSLAAPFDMQFAVPRTPAPPPPPLGTKEEGPLVVASPAMAPSTSGAAPRGPADVSAAVRPAGPLAGKLPFQVKAENERFAKSVEMADDVRQATKAGISTAVGSQFGIKKGGPPSTVGYFQNRAEVALELKDKRGKLDRIASSGPGKVAKDLWSQNSKSGKPFENTWQEIQMTFAGDQKSLEVAHEVALAYDIIAKEDKAPLKQSPN
jgi:hypothetical protein